MDKPEAEARLNYTRTVLTGYILEHYVKCWKKWEEFQSMASHLSWSFTYKWLKKNPIKLSEKTERKSLGK